MLRRILGVKDEITAIRCIVSGRTDLRRRTLCATSYLLKQIIPEVAEGGYTSGMNHGQPCRPRNNDRLRGCFVHSHNTDQKSNTSRVVAFSQRPNYSQDARSY
jgi:hypothetical protein